MSSTPPSPTLSAISTASSLTPSVAGAYLHASTTQMPATGSQTSPSNHFSNLSFISVFDDEMVDSTAKNMYSMFSTSLNENTKIMLSPAKNESKANTSLITPKLADVSYGTQLSSGKLKSSFGLLNARDRKELVSRIKSLRLDIQAAQLRRQTLARRLNNLESALAESIGSQGGNGNSGRNINAGRGNTSLAVRDAAISAALAALEESITELDTVIPGAYKNANANTSEPSEELRSVLPPPSQLVPVQAPEAAKAVSRSVAEVAEDPRGLAFAIRLCISSEEDLLTRCLRVLRFWKYTVRVSAAVRIQRLWRGYLARTPLMGAVVHCPGAPRTLDSAVSMVVQARRLAARITPYEKWSQLELIMEKTSVKRAVARRTTRMARKRTNLHPELPILSPQQLQQQERDLCRPLYQLYSRVKVLLAAPAGGTANTTTVSQGASLGSSSAQAKPSQDAEVKAVAFGNAEPHTGEGKRESTGDPTSEKRSRTSATHSHSSSNRPERHTGSPSNDAATNALPGSSSGSGSGSSKSSSSHQKQQQQSSVSTDLEFVRRLLAEPIPSTQNELNTLVDYLKTEKRSLQIVLNQFEREFERMHGRKIRFQADILPVQTEWGVYRETKARLAELTEIQTKGLPQKESQ